MCKILLNDIFILWLIVSPIIDVASDVSCGMPLWSRNGKTVAGGHGPGNKTDQLNYPYGLFVDQNRTMFIADQNNHRIIKWEYGASSGVVVAGGNDKGEQSNQLYKPYDVIVDSTGNLYVADENKITRWSKDAITGRLVAFGRWFPGMVLDATENHIYATDWSNNRVMMYETNGRSSGITMISHIRAPWGIAIDKKGVIYTARYQDYAVVKWTVNTTEVEIVAGHGGFGHGLDQLNWPAGIFVDDYGALYIADTNNARIIRVLDGSKTGSVIAGGNYQGNASDQLVIPFDVTLDSNGNLYVSDTYNHRIQMFEIDRNSCREESKTTSMENTIIDDKFSISTSATIGKYVTSLFDTTTFTYIGLFFILLGMSYLFARSSFKQVIASSSEKELLV